MRQEQVPKKLLVVAVRISVRAVALVDRLMLAFGPYESSRINKLGGCVVGALWNGMVAPFINSTIFGALWYQV